MFSRAFQDQYQFPYNSMKDEHVKYKRKITKYSRFEIIDPTDPPATIAEPIEVTDSRDLVEDTSLPVIGAVSSSKSPTTKSSTTLSKGSNARARRHDQSASHGGYRYNTRKSVPVGGTRMSKWQSPDLPRKWLQDDEMEWSTADADIDRMASVHWPGGQENTSLDAPLPLHSPPVVSLDPPQNSRKSSLMSVERRPEMVGVDGFVIHEVVPVIKGYKAASNTSSKNENMAVAAAVIIPVDSKKSPTNPPRSSYEKRKQRQQRLALLLEKPIVPSPEKTDVSVYRQRTQERKKDLMSTSSDDIAKEDASKGRPPWKAHTRPRSKRDPVATPLQLMGATSVVDGRKKSGQIIVSKSPAVVRDEPDSPIEMTSTSHTTYTDAEGQNQIALVHKSSRSRIHEAKAKLSKIDVADDNIRYESEILQQPARDNLTTAATIRTTSIRPDVTIQSNLSTGGAPSSSIYTTEGAFGRTSNSSDKISAGQNAETRSTRDELASSVKTVSNVPKTILSSRSVTSNEYADIISKSSVYESAASKGKTGSDEVRPTRIVSLPPSSSSSSAYTARVQHQTMAVDDLPTLKQKDIVVSRSQLSVDTASTLIRHSAAPKRFQLITVQSAEPEAKSGSTSMTHSASKGSIHSSGAKLINSFSPPRSQTGIRDDLVAGRVVVNPIVASVSANSKSSLARSMIRDRPVTAASDEFPMLPTESALLFSYVPSSQSQMIVHDDHAPGARVLPVVPSDSSKSFSSLAKYQSKSTITADPTARTKILYPILKASKTSVESIGSIKPPVVAVGKMSRNNLDYPNDIPPKFYPSTDLPYSQPDTASHRGTPSIPRQPPENMPTPSMEDLIKAFSEDKTINKQPRKTLLPSEIRFPMSSGVSDSNHQNAEVTIGSYVGVVRKDSYQVVLQKKPSINSVLSSRNSDLNVFKKPSLASFERPGNEVLVSCSQKSVDNPDRQNFVSALRAAEKRSRESNLPVPEPVKMYPFNPSDSDIPFVDSSDVESISRRFNAQK